jgi:hypothetical protein
MATNARGRNGGVREELATGVTGLVGPDRTHARREKYQLIATPKERPDDSNGAR